MDSINTVIKIKVIDQQLSFIESPFVASGNINTVTTLFEFDESWDGFIKTAVFYRDKTDPKPSVLHNDECYVRQEVMDTNGRMYIGVFGVKDDKVKTSEIVFYDVGIGVPTTGEMEEPDETVWHQILNELKDIRSLVEQIKQEEQKFIEQQEKNFDTLKNDLMDAETLRVQAESNRVIAEEERKNAETDRVNAENERAETETLRANAEQSRETAESLRVEAEKNRVTAENGRATAETNRVSAENERVTKWSELKSEIEEVIDGILNIDKIYPIGSIYMSVVDNNPSNFIGGTWERFAQGKTLIGVDENDSDFNTVKKTGGAKTVTLTVEQMPSHTHTQNAHNHSASGSSGSSGAHTHTITVNSGGAHTHTISGTAASAGSHNHLLQYGYGSGSSFVYAGAMDGKTTDRTGTPISSSGAHTHSVSGSAGSAGSHSHSASSSSAGSHTHTISVSVSNATAVNNNTGGGQEHNNLQPYITTYMYVRTA